jgi:serine phosphatase RsbU (regulator of sigma subunit)
VTAVNKFVNPRRPYSKFVTAWVGTFDLKNRTLRYVDAGHSYALLKSSDGALTALDAGGGMPIGVVEDAVYQSEAIALPEHGQVLVVSDGIVEQFGIIPGPDGTMTKAHFDMQGVKRSFSASRLDADVVAELFAAVVHYAGTEHLSDDATAVLVRW